MSARSGVVKNPHRETNRDPLSVLCSSLSISIPPRCWSAGFTEKEEENQYVPNSKAWVGSRRVQPLSVSREEGLASYERTVLSKQLEDQGNGSLGTVITMQA